MKKSTKYGIAILICFSCFLVMAVVALTVVISVYLFHNSSQIWPEREALPATATDVRDLHYGTRVDPDYFLKARISAEEFEIYRKSLGYVPLPEGKEKYVSWKFILLGHDISGWWVPTESRDGTYYNPKIGISTANGAVMKYEGGYLYFHSWSGY